MSTPVALTVAMVAEATGGRVVTGDAARAFDGVSIDTRAVARGSMFVALRGDRFDAHDFLAEAVAGGAAGVLVSREPGEPLGVPTIVVPDTLLALQSLARAVRAASGARVIAITGSAGKTTTKEATADLLSASFAVHRTRGNFNNHIGLPLSLIGLYPGFDIAVVELGMNHAGEIGTLVDIARPDIRVWINVGDAHVGHFGSREAVADAKAEILEGARPDTVLVANADDPLVMSRVENFPGRTVTFGEGAAADVRATHVVDRGFDGVGARVITRFGETDLDVPLPGRVHLSNVLAAVAVAIECGVPIDVIASRVALLRAGAGRGAVLRLSNGTRIVDDSYNASPAAVDAALTALAATVAAGRRVAVLGEMLELGEASATLHEACGYTAARAGVDVLVAIGGDVMDAMLRGAISGGLPTAHAHRFVDSASAAPAVENLVAPGDVVLVKGSRGTRTDVVVDRLKAVA
jgi:UDP-N-acetylmuramoyl-tripeptide--D-alanyl-D-alanine ligase